MILHTKQIEFRLFLFTSIKKQLLFYKLYDPAHKTNLIQSIFIHFYKKTITILQTLWSCTQNKFNSVYLYSLL